MKKTTDSIHHPITVDPLRGRVKQERDHVEYVEQLIKQVLFTAPGERINRPDFGCGIRQMIFGPRIAGNLVQVMVSQALDKWLSDVIRVDRVQAESNEEKLSIDITYTVLSRQERRYLNLEVAV
jgi:phage baseplate assembly protein W